MLEECLSELNTPPNKEKVQNFLKTTASPQSLLPSKWRTAHQSVLGGNIQPIFLPCQITALLSAAIPYRCKNSAVIHPNSGRKDRLQSQMASKLTADRKINQKKKPPNELQSFFSCQRTHSQTSQSPPVPTPARKDETQNCIHPLAK